MEWVCFLFLQTIINLFIGCIHLACLGSLVALDSMVLCTIEMLSVVEVGSFVVQEGVVGLPCYQNFLAALVQVVFPVVKKVNTNNMFKFIEYIHQKFKII